MISLVQVMIAAMTLITIPNVALVMQTGLVVQKPTNVEKDLGTVIQIVNVKKALNVGRIIVMIMELSLVLVMTAASCDYWTWQPKDSKIINPKSGRNCFHYKTGWK